MSATSRSSVSGSWVLDAGRRRVALVPLLAVVLSIIVSLGAAANDRLAPYTYQDTKTLVALVEDAAALMEQKGEQAFDAFAQKSSKWLNDDHYLFAYSLDGVCLFHPITPSLVGRDVMSLKDVNGKYVIRMITDVGRKDGNDAYGWVFHLWEDGPQLAPTWKSSYVRKVILPDGRVIVVGSGSYHIKTEKAFVEERVRSAANLLKIAGRAGAFPQFKNVSSPFVFLNSYIFVLDKNGRALVDPSFPSIVGRELADFKDAVGFPVIKELLAKLARSDEAWVQYLWPKPGAQVPSRKLLYARKVEVNGHTLIVGSDFYLATPIWMRVEQRWPQNPRG